MRLTEADEWRTLRQLICELDLISHGTTQSFDPMPPDSTDGQGGKRPSGGPQDDGRRRWDGGPPDETVLRSADYFRHRAQGCRSVDDVVRAIEDARRALESWKHTPAPAKGDNPEPGDSLFKRYVAESEEPVKVLAARHGVSSAYISKIRRGYRDAA